MASEYSPRMTFAMGNLNMTRYYAPDDRYNDTGVLMTVITEQGWEYTVPKEVEFSLDTVKQVWNAPDSNIQMVICIVSVHR